MLQALSPRPTSEVELDDFQIADDHRRLGGRLLVIVVPLAAEPFGLVPHLDQLLVVLDHHRVLVELALGVRFGTWTSTHRFNIQSNRGWSLPLDSPQSCHTTAVVDDGESEIDASSVRLDVDAVIAAELAFGEDQAVEWPVE